MSERSDLRTVFWVARRYLRSTRRDAFISFLTATAAVGLALGVAALVVALAMLTGFQSALKAEILERTPQIEVILPEAREAKAVRARLEEVPGVVEAQVIARGQGWLISDGRVRAVELHGFERRLPRTFPGALDRAPGVYVSSQLRDVWNLEAGTAIEIASSRPTLTPLGPQPRVRRGAVHGWFTSGRTDLHERVAIPLETAAVLLGDNSRRIQLEAGSLDDALSVARSLPERLPEGSEVLTWQEMNRGLFFALRLEKSLMFVAVFLIVAVGALALVSDLTLIIAAKRREVGILGAMGLSPVELRRIFTSLGLLLAGTGVACGATVGVVLAWALDRFRLIRVPDGVYFLDHVPFQIRPLDVTSILAAALLVTVLGSGWAARRAAALQPVDALRR